MSDELAPPSSTPAISTGDLDCPDRRNELALIRTDLANERTLLAYIRTALMMAGTGGTLIKFFGESRDMLILGVSLLTLGAVLGVFGVIRCRRQHNRIRS